MESFNTKPSHITVNKMEAHQFGEVCTICKAPAIRRIEIGAHWGINSIFNFCLEHSQELVDKIAG